MPRLLIVKAPAGELRWRQPASPYCGARLPSAALAAARGAATEAPPGLTGLSGHHQNTGRELVRADPPEEVQVKLLVRRQGAKAMAYSKSRDPVPASPRLNHA